MQEDFHFDSLLLDILRLKDESRPVILTSYSFQQSTSPKEDTPGASTETPAWAVSQIELDTGFMGSPDLRRRFVGILGIVNYEHNVTTCTFNLGK